MHGFIFFYICTISCRGNCEKSQKYIDIVFGIDFELLFGYNIIQKHERKLKENCCRAAAKDLMRG